MSPITEEIARMRKRREERNMPSMVGRAMRGVNTMRGAKQDDWEDVLVATLLTNIAGGALSAYGEYQLEGAAQEDARAGTALLEEFNREGGPRPDVIEQYKESNPTLLAAALEKQFGQDRAQKLALDTAEKKSRLEQELAAEFFPDKLEQTGQLTEAQAKARAKYPTAGAGSVNLSVGVSDQLRAAAGMEPTGEPLTATESHALRAVAGLEAAGRRQDLAEGKHDITTGQLRVPGWEPGPDAAVLDKVEARDLRTKQVSTLKIIKDVEKMAENDQFTLSGVDAIENELRSANMMENLRAFRGSGANFTESEMKIAKTTILPSLANGQSLRAIFQELTGRDKQDFVTVVSKMLQEDMDIEMSGRGYVRPTPIEAEALSGGSSRVSKIKGILSR